MNPHDGTVAQYVSFAEHAPDSPCFHDWALRVAGDPDVLAWLDSLPVPKRQPNLVFAAARWHGVPAPGPYAGLRDALLGDDGPLRETILARATQTNEVGRLATLLPVFSRYDGPLALLEVGASAGLNLHPDRYDYAWPPRGGLTGSGGPVLSAAVTGDVPVPLSRPEVAWRGGIDLHPLDVRDDDAMAWLETLVWPEHADRRAQLRAAIAIAREDPVALVTGDLLDALPALLEEASSYGTPVVFHSAVIAYLTADDRARFAAMMRDLVAAGRCHWVSNESPLVIPGVDVPEDDPRCRFLLLADGEPVAWTHSHGRALDWV
ncbi:MAG: hypothetical protein JWO46_3424 [Nocardioidaceae bacterium]|nr:hypothetical protein [Nocardioidaceae bacterium]